MQNFDTSDMVEVVSPYFTVIKEAQRKSFLNTVAIKDMLHASGIPIIMKPRTKGSIISDCIRTYLEKELANDPNARIIELNDFPALLLHEQILIRFNKMDRKFQTAIQKRRGYQNFMNQGEVIEGFSPDIVRIWAGFIPVDKQWSDIARYFLACFDAGKLVWFNDLANYSVEQLSINLEPTKKRRITPKKRSGEEGQQTRTGTEK